MLRRPYREIDVFTATAYRGNALAVVVDATGLATEQMQQFARWTNLSETSFLLPPSDARADYQVRIFTPSSELPFAGHPTLGSCHAWLAQGGKPRQADEILQQCPAGLVRLRRTGTQLGFCAPPLRRAPVDPGLLSEVTRALGLAPQSVRHSQMLDNGPGWLGLVIDSAATVLALEPDHTRLKKLANVGLIGPYGTTATGAGAPDFEVRAFADPQDIAEDPVTGSLNAALGQWLIPAGLLPSRYLVSQGTRLQRAGRVTVEACTQATEVWISGDCVSCVEGTVLL